VVVRTSQRRSRLFPLSILLVLTGLSACHAAATEPSCSLIAADTLPNGILVTAEMCPHLATQP
jgi:hypothetical protein